MLVDTIQIQLEAGRGGRGAIAFQKTRLAKGPTGADGGRGGSVYVEGIADINGLARYAGRKVLRAENGKDGRGQFLDGRVGEDLTIYVPTGTIITNQSTKFSREISKIGERILILGGGNGGRGNFKFRSSTNTSPKIAEDGTEGDRGTFTFELRLIADVGLVGLPNAGKSSLLNALTAAKSKVASYAFTTLEPHLGSYFGKIIADIPGLIAGASEGKGLGDKFLRHVERTKTLFHLVSSESEDPIGDYKTVREELKAYDPALAEKKEHVFLTKCDAVTAERLAEISKAFKKIKVTATPITILDDTSLDTVKEILNALK